jgi:large subunit ribosomal protein L10
MRPEKKYIDQEYQQLLSRASAIVLADYRGLSAESMNRLRSRLRDLPAEFMVVKNRLCRRSLEGSPFEKVSPFIEEQTAMVLGGENFPEILKCLLEFKKETGAPSMRGGMWAEEIYDPNGLLRLAELPSRSELLSRMVAGVQAPLSGLVGTLSQVMRGLLNVLKEMGQQKERGAG